MNAPAQPELQLRDIHLPGPPDLWPPAPGWWILAAVVLSLLIWGSIVLLRHLKIQRQRRRILAMLQHLEGSNSDAATPEFLAQLSRLTRRLALMRYPRREIASLTGRDWLRFLDRSGGDGRFSQGPGQVLAQGPYMRELSGTEDIAALTSLVRQWVNRNAGGRYES